MLENYSYQIWVLKSRTVIGSHNWVNSTADFVLMKQPKHIMCPNQSSLCIISGHHIKQQTAPETIFPSKECIAKLDYIFFWPCWSSHQNITSRCIHNLHISPAILDRHYNLKGKYCRRTFLLASCKLQLDLFLSQLLSKYDARGHIRLLQPSMHPNFPPCLHAILSWIIMLGLLLFANFGIMDHNSGANTNSVIVPHSQQCCHLLFSPGICWP